MLADAQGKGMPSAPAVFVGTERSSEHPPGRQIHGAREHGRRHPDGLDESGNRVRGASSGWGSEGRLIPTFFVVGASGSVFLDDVSLERVDAGTPLSPLAKP